MDRILKNLASSLTGWVIIVCVALFIADSLNLSIGTTSSSGVMYFDRYSPVARMFMYDIPENPGHFWHGYYDQVLAANQLGIENWFAIYSPVFEKISQGEIWRLFTPAVLHGSLLHILMNLMIFHMVGLQMESRMGPYKFLLFMLVTALFSNFCQYVMGGFRFVGLSGVISAQVAFIWYKMDFSPGEGYYFPRNNLNFLAFFVLGLAALQCVVFFIELSGGHGFPLGIANTAHVMGGVAGWFCGRLNIFKS